METIKGFQPARTVVCNANVPTCKPGRKAGLPASATYLASSTFLKPCELLKEYVYASDIN